MFTVWHFSLQKVWEMLYFQKAGEACNKLVHWQVPVVIISALFFFLFSFFFISLWVLLWTHGFKHSWCPSIPYGDSFEPQGILSLASGHLQLARVLLMWSQMCLSISLRSYTFSNFDLQSTILSQEPCFFLTGNGI